MKKKRKHIQSFDLFVSPTECDEAVCVKTQVLEDITEQSAFNLKVAEVAVKGFVAEKARADRLQVEVDFLRQVLVRMQTAEYQRQVTTALEPWAVKTEDPFAVAIDTKRKTLVERHSLRSKKSITFPSEKKYCCVLFLV